MIRIEEFHWNTPEEKALMKALAGQIEKIVRWARIAITGPKGDRTMFVDLDRVKPRQLYSVLSILMRIGEVEEIFGAGDNVRIAVKLGGGKQ